MGIKKKFSGHLNISINVLQYLQILETHVDLNLS